MTRRTVVAPRFRTEVALHLVRNLAQSPLPGTPLLLGIHGESGSGKSFQLDVVLEETGVFVSPISSAELESDHANDPARLVRRTYLDTADRLESTDIAAAAVVVNDIDAALGDWGALVQYTVNRQLVIGELMHLCDRPQSVTGAPNARVPIFLTANDFSKLYGPLLRPGRLKLFHWKPDERELAAIVAAMLPALERNEVAYIVDAFPRRSPAFFAEAINEARDQLIRLALAERGIHDTVRAAKQGYIDPAAAVTADQLLDAAARVASSEGEVQDYSLSSLGTR